MESDKKKMEREVTEQSKKPWNEPKLTVHGRVEDLTQGVVGQAQTDGSSGIP